MAYYFGSRWTLVMFKKKQKETLGFKQKFICEASLQKKMKTRYYGQYNKN